MDAYELPKLIPTTVGIEETSMGASALPFCWTMAILDEEVREMVKGRRSRLSSTGKGQILGGARIPNPD